MSCVNSIIEKILLFLLKNIKESQPACEECLLLDKEGKGMRVDIFASFQSRLKSVDLRGDFTTRIFPI